MADEEPPKPPPRRSSAPLAAGVALLLGVPLAGFALKVWGPLLFEPDEAPRPVVEITGPRKLSIPGAAASESRASSIDMVEGPAGPAQAAAAPAPGGPAAAPAPAQAAPRQPQAPPPLQAERPRYPKLRPNHGWKSWFARQGLPSGVPDPVAPTQQQQEQKPQEPPNETAAAAPASAAPSPPAPVPPPAPQAAKPARQGYKPPAPVYSAADQANQVSAGVGLGTADVAAGASAPPPKRVWTEHSTFPAPSDAAPQPNPEKPRTPDGPCPRRGWWKSPTTRLCYFSHASCQAVEYDGAGCFQPNP